MMRCLAFLGYDRYAYQPSFILKPLVTAITLAYFLLHDDLMPLPLAAETIGSECSRSRSLVI